MTKLPEKNLLSGNRLPRTTTGEMKEALGKLRDYLSELLGDDSSDKETARQALGIDLMQWAGKIEAKADRQDIDSVLSGKADKTELDSKVQELEEAIARRGTPIGSIDYFAMATPPAGYLKADGAAVGRDTCPELFAAIGTTFGEGDGETTFNLPDLIGRFAQGNNTPGQKIEAGLPDITGGVGLYNSNNTYGATRWNASNYDGMSVSSAGSGTGYVEFAASFANPIYGNSNTVQPPALTLLPCIKAFDAATNPGLIDITGLANAVARHKYVTESCNDGPNWYRKWSDGWIEQGGDVTSPVIIPNNDVQITATLPKPMRNDYSVSMTQYGFYDYWPWVRSTVIRSPESLTIAFFNTGAGNCGSGTWSWHVAGMAA